MKPESEKMAGLSYRLVSSGRWQGFCCQALWPVFGLERGAEVMVLKKSALMKTKVESCRVRGCAAN